METTTQLSETKQQSSSPTDVKVKKHLKVTEINYRRNKESNYTEKIEELDKNFNYSSNREHFWSKPELSVLYGTPLYEAASPSQKIALNHLYWVGNYNATAASEIYATLYNELTASVFYAIGGYETLCHELDIETSQERYHIHAFRTIGNMTEMALLGEIVIGNPTIENTPNLVQKGTGLHVLTGPLGQFFRFNVTSSPFLASQFYTFRFISNQLLKIKEHHYFQYFMELEKKGEFIPAPTAVSRYHFLDESFHTTTSQLIAHDLYKDFSKPTAYEKFLANLTIYMMQLTFLNGLSGGFPASFSKDGLFVMPLIYRILRTPLFDMSAREALNWIEKCFCQEHEGFHVSFKSHQRLLSELRRFFDGIDFAWPVNREMRVMASGGSISKAIQSNTKFFKHFSKSVAC